MKTKEYKKLCRIKVTRLAKFITCLTTICVLWLCELLGIGFYPTAALSTFVWFYLPDVATYGLESAYRLTHDKVSYR